MIESLILVEGKTVKQDALKISLANAKQLIIGSTPGFGIVLHVAANSPDDLGKALLDFAKVKGVSKILTLAIQSQ